MQNEILFFYILVLSAFVAPLPQPNEKNNVQNTVVNNEGETPQRDDKVLNNPETDYKHVNHHNVDDDAVYKNQNTYPHQHALNDYRRPVHQYPRYPPVYHGYNSHPAHRPQNPTLIPKPYHHGETIHEDSGEDPALYSGHLEREPREDAIPLMYSDHNHHPPIYPQISEHPYHGHPPLPLYHSQINEYPPPYPIYNRHVPRKSVLPIYLFSAPGGSQIRNYFQRILQKVPQRMNIKKKPKIIIEYLNGTVEYVDIPDVIEYAPGVILKENGEKTLEVKNGDNILPREDVSVIDPSYVVKQKYIQRPPSEGGQIITARIPYHQYPNKINQKEEGDIEEYVVDPNNEDLIPQSSIDTIETPKVALVVGEIAPKVYSDAEDSSVVDPAEDSYYYIKRKGHLRQKASDRDKVIRYHNQYRYDPTENRPENDNLEDESYNDGNFPDSGPRPGEPSRETIVVEDTPQDPITREEYSYPKNYPEYSYYDAHYVSPTPYSKRGQHISYPIKYRRIHTNIGREDSKPEKPVNYSYKDDKGPDSSIDSKEPSRDTSIIRENQPDNYPNIGNNNVEDTSNTKQERQNVDRKPTRTKDKFSAQNEYQQNLTNSKLESENQVQPVDASNKKNDYSNNDIDSSQPSQSAPIVRDTKQNDPPNIKKEPENDSPDYELPSDSTINSKESFGTVEGTKQDDLTLKENPEHNSKQDKQKPASDKDQLVTSHNQNLHNSEPKFDKTEKLIDDSSNSKHFESGSAKLSTTSNAGDVIPETTTTKGDYSNSENDPEHKYNIKQKRYGDTKTPVISQFVTSQNQNQDNVKPVKNDTDKPDLHDSDKYSDSGINTKEATIGNSNVTSTKQDATLTRDESLPNHKNESTLDENKKPSTDKFQFINVKTADIDKPKQDLKKQDHYPDSAIDSSDTSTIKDTKTETTYTKNPQSPLINKNQIEDEPSENNATNVKQKENNGVELSDDFINYDNQPDSKVDTKEVNADFSTRNKPVTTTTKTDDSDKELAYNVNKTHNEGSTNLSEKPIDDAPNDDGYLDSGVDTQETTTVTSNIEQSKNDHSQPENDSAVDKDKKTSDISQVITPQDKDNRNSSNDTPQNNNTEKPKEDSYNNDIFSVSSTEANEPSTVTQYSIIAEDNNPETDFVRDLDNNKKQKPSDSPQNEYHPTIVNVKNYDDDIMKPKDDSNNGDTPETAFDDTKTDDDQPVPINDSENSYITKRQHRDGDTEKPIDDSSNNDNYSNSGAEFKETTTVTSTVRSTVPDFTTTKDSNPNLDDVNPIKKDTQQNQDTDIKYATTETKDNKKSKKATNSQFDVAAKPSDDDKSTKMVREEHSEKRPKDSDKSSRDSKRETDGEFTNIKPTSTSETHDENYDYSTTTEKSSEGNNLDSNIDEEKESSIGSSTAYEDIHEKNPDDSRTDNKNIKIPVENIDNTASRKAPEEDNDHYDDQGNEEDQDVQGSAEDQDVQGSVEDQDDSETVQGDSPIDSSANNTDDDSFDDSSEEQFEDDGNEREETDKDNYGIEERDQSKDIVEENDQDQDKVKKTGLVNDESSLKSTTLVDLTSTETTTSASTADENIRESTTEELPHTTTIYNKHNDGGDNIDNDENDQGDEDEENFVDESNSKDVPCNKQENNKRNCKNQDSSAEIAPLVSFHPDTDFYKKLIEEYNRLHFFRMNSSASVIHRDTKSLVFENGTVVDYLSETYWEKENDDKPIKIRTSQVIRQPLKKEENDC